MSNYVKSTDFEAKDALATGNPAKLVKGAELEVEFDAIAAAVATKADSSNLSSYQETSAKGVANGYAGLNSSAQLVDDLSSVSQISGFQNATSNIGYMNVPQNSQSANYTLVIGDAGKHILHPNGAGTDTFTIPANASVAFPVGTVVTFVNVDTSSVSIAINSDTLTLAGTTSSGTRTLTQNGLATAIKVGSTTWLISGSGLT